MIWPDLVNGGFELLGAAFAWRNFLELRRERRLVGVYWPTTAFFAAWGAWNLIYYPALGQWASGPASPAACCWSPAMPPGWCWRCAWGGRNDGHLDWPPARGPAAHPGRRRARAAARARGHGSRGEPIDDALVQQLAALCDEEVQAPKFLVFVDALAQLCKAHGVTLSTSGYDGLQVWDADDKSGPIHCAGIEDLMKPNVQGNRPGAALCDRSA